MISVQDYRIAIGCFLGKAQVSFFVSKKQEVLNKARRKQNNSNLNQQEEVLTLPFPSLGYVSGGGKQ